VHWDCFDLDQHRQLGNVCLRPHIRRYPALLSRHRVSIITPVTTKLFPHQLFTLRAISAPERCTRAPRSLPYAISHKSSMTTFDTRSPLQALSMVSSQRPARRRSAQNAFDDEDAPPAKRPKIDGEEKSQVNGHTSGADGRRKKPCKWSNVGLFDPLPHRQVRRVSFLTCDSV